MALSVNYHVIFFKYVISFFKTIHDGCLLKAGLGLVGYTILITNIPWYWSQFMSIPDTLRLSLQYLRCYILSVILRPSLYFADRHAFYFFIALLPYRKGMVARPSICTQLVPVRNILLRSEEIMLWFPGPRRLRFVSRFSVSYVIDLTMWVTRVGIFWVQVPPIDALVCLVWYQSFHYDARFNFCIRISSCSVLSPSLFDNSECSIPLSIKRCCFLNFLFPFYLFS